MLTLDGAITAAREHDRQRLFATLTAAFADDPGVRWMYPAEEQYRRHFPRFAAALGGRAVEHGTADWMTDGAAALWLPPGIGADETTLAGVVAQSVPARHRTAVFALFEAMAAHHPSEAHWYLPLIGVEPALQGRGYGSELLAHGLARCDRERSLAYLESTNPRNIPLYQRHGFQVVGRIEVASSPPIVPMLRHPHYDNSRLPVHIEAPAALQPAGHPPKPAVGHVGPPQLKRYRRRQSLPGVNRLSTIRLGFF